MILNATILILNATILHPCLGKECTIASGLHCVLFILILLKYYREVCANFKTERLNGEALRPATVLVLADRLDGRNGSAPRPQTPEICQQGKGHRGAATSHK